MKGWNQLPRTLRVAFVAWAALLALRLAAFVLARVDLLDLDSPSMLGVQLLALVGVAQLAHRCPSMGLRLVIGGQIAQCVLYLAFYLLGAVWSVDAALGDRLEKLTNYGLIVADAFA